MDTPLVSVVCLCYNQARFVQESMMSILNQTYPRVEIIVVDDASTDGSAGIIQETIKDYPAITFLPLLENIRNCRAFNKGLALAKGEYVIDLAADDVLMPSRIATGINALILAGAEYGVHFSDAELIDEKGNHIGFHSDRFPHQSIPEGDIFKDLIARYFICSPSMMIRKSVLEKLGGYDESLAYEDFDFWIRSSRDSKYCYTGQPLVKRRRVAQSMSKNQYTRDSPQLVSTLQVCKKIMLLSRDHSERRALTKRILYEMKKAAELGAWNLVLRYFGLLIRNGV